MPRNAYPIKYGKEGDRFYILVNGMVSIWVPVEPNEMARHLLKIKQQVIKFVENISTQTLNFDFRFFLDRDKVNDTLSA